tara:strand:- start:2788 stop:3225 length:438 start_codon:yes stop_codon:yes gene_type:complete
MLKDQISIFCNSITQDGKSKISLRYLKDTNPNLFYPQDWYENEKFMDESFESGLYTLPKNVLSNSRGKTPSNESLYPASLIAYIFIMHYKTFNEILWPHDYIWCDNFDSNGDQIYIGRYYDPLGLSKDGFSIHRHLSIKQNYGWL